MCRYCEKNEFESLNTTVDYSGLEIAMSGRGILRVRNYNFKKLFETQDAVDINYCPMCRKEAGRVKRYASGYWYQFIIPRRLTLPPVRIYRWLNFFWRLKDKEESYE